MYLSTVNLHVGHKTIAAFFRTAIFGEAFIQKVTGIVILVLALRYMGYRLKDIGFGKAKALRGILIGLGLGLGVFTLPCGVECVFYSM